MQKMPQLSAVIQEKHITNAFKTAVPAAMSAVAANAFAAIVRTTTPEGRRETTRRCATRLDVSGVVEAEDEVRMRALHEAAAARATDDALAADDESAEDEAQPRRGVHALR